MSGIGLYALAQQQRTQAERIGLELARALATAVDGELRSSIAALQALATSVALERDDLPAFRERARRILESQPNWAAVFLADPSGRRLLDTRFRHRIDLPIIERESFDRVLRTRAPAVGNLARSPDGALLFAVRVPVTQGGELRYVLTALVKPELILQVVTRQRMPPDWIISIFDAKGLRVARSRAHEQNLGGRASPTLQAMMVPGAEEGVGQTRDLEGGRNYASFSRLKESGWTVAPGIPAAFVEGAGIPIAGDLRKRYPALDRPRGDRGDRRRPQHQPADRRPARLGAGARPARGADRAGDLDPGDSRRGGRAGGRGRRARQRGGAARGAVASGTASAGDGRGGQSGEGRVPRGAVARAADASQRGLRLGAGAAGRSGPRRGGRAGARHDRPERRRAGAAHRRPARCLPGRLGQDASGRPAGRSEGGHRGGPRRSPAGGGGQGDSPRRPCSIPARGRSLETRPVSSRWCGTW